MAGRLPAAVAAHSTVRSGQVTGWPTMGSRVEPGSKVNRALVARCPGCFLKLAGVKGFRLVHGVLLAEVVARLIAIGLAWREYASWSSNCASILEWHVTLLPRSDPCGRSPGYGKARLFREEAPVPPADLAAQIGAAGGGPLAHGLPGSVSNCGGVHTSSACHGSRRNNPSRRTRFISGRSHVPRGVLRVAPMG